MCHLHCSCPTFSIAEQFPVNNGFKVIVAEIQNDYNTTSEDVTGNVGFEPKGLQMTEVS